MLHFFKNYILSKKYIIKYLWIFVNLYLQKINTIICIHYSGILGTNSVHCLRSDPYLNSCKNWDITQDWTFVHKIGSRPTLRALEQTATLYQTQYSARFLRLTPTHIPTATSSLHPYLMLFVFQFNSYLALCGVFWWTSLDYLFFE